MGGGGEGVGVRVGVGGGGVLWKSRRFAIARFWFLFHLLCDCGTYRICPKAFDKRP